jgi:hypothetical protein
MIAANMHLVRLEDSADRSQTVFHAHLAELHEHAHTDEKRRAGQRTYRPLASARYFTEVRAAQQRWVAEEDTETAALLELCIGQEAALLRLH